ncbi:MAG: hypothetical protein AAB320_06025 [Elusimicrobiota bacterium]
MASHGLIRSVGQATARDHRQAEELPNLLLPEEIGSACRELVDERGLGPMEEVYGATYRALELGWRPFRDLVRAQYWGNPSLLEPKNDPHAGTLLADAAGPEVPAYFQDPAKLAAAKAYYRGRFQKFLKASRPP